MVLMCYFTNLLLFIKESEDGSLRRLLYVLIKLFIYNRNGHSYNTKPLEDSNQLKKELDNLSQAHNTISQTLASKKL